ncbi:glycosyltransferase family 4 protein [Aquiflexum sp.]|uniref:glycosyltransferase family 4 protein n=1 Tax=Aquiflexum sp. TaxID=1872584 RepID=UPI003593D3C7
MSNRRVLVIHSAADLYGASKNLVRSLSAFKKLGWKVFIVLPHDGPLVNEIRAEGFEVMMMEHGVLRRQNLNPKGMLLLANQLRKSFFFLSRLIKKEKIDLIYTNSNANIIGGFLSLRHRLPHIWHVHEIVLQPKWFKNLLEFFIKVTGDQVLCVSEAVKNNFSQIEPERLKLIYNGIEINTYKQAEYDLKSELGIPSDTILIGMIARVSFWKGQIYFLDIAAQLCQKFPNLHFVMVGDAFTGYEYLYEEIDLHIQKLNLIEHVSFLGYRLDVPQILNGLDIFILPSILPDPLPTTVLEAMAAGKPVVATNQGGATEMVVDKETGLLIPYDNPEESAVKVQQLIENPELRRQMGRKGQERAKEFFSIDKYLENFGKAVLEVRKK